MRGFKGCRFIDDWDCYCDCQCDCWGDGGGILELAAGSTRSMLVFTCFVELVGA